VLTSGSYTLGINAQVEVLTARGVKTNLSLAGNAYINTITGNEGDNKLSGGFGNDILKGGSGKDTFIFNSALDKSTNVDSILDFSTKFDSIWLDNAVFTKVGRGSAAGVKFKADMFVEGTRAKDREDRLVYDKKTGLLYYDQDGTGSKSQVKIATIINKTTLKFDDFFVI